ncbi:hypothetical protein EJB05_57325, partial [Eragrostis curvula]
MVTRHRDLHVSLSGAAILREHVAAAYGRLITKEEAAWNSGRLIPSAAVAAPLSAASGAGPRLIPLSCAPKFRSHFPTGAMVGQSCRIRWSASSFVVTQQHPRMSDKADWCDANLRHFIDICKGKIEAGNRPHGQFTRN